VTRREFSNKLALLIGCLTICAVGLVAFAEILMIWPLPGWLYASIGIAAAVGGAVIMALHSNLRRWAATFALLSILGIVLRLIYVGQWSSRKAYLHKLNRIEMGMSRAGVEQIMTAYMPWYLREIDPNLPVNGEMHFRHNDVDADFGVVTFHNNRVVNVQFWPD
jgi:hypothetical protein